MTDVSKGSVALAAVLGGALLAGPAAAFHEDLIAHYGKPIAGTTAHVVTIGADTTLIKARYFETLTIRNEKGQSFTWRFDTLHAPTGFPLKTIAPAEFEAGDTWVYVGPKANPD